MNRCLEKLLDIRHGRFFGVFLCSLPVLSGCHFLKPKPAAEVLTMREPEEGENYYLYKPTTYRDDRDWPVIVLCHAVLWENPSSVISDWAKVAEDRGVVLLAPRLQSTTDIPPDSDRQNELQERDEQAVLLALQHVRGQCRIATDKIFIAGAQAGGRAALFVGLRNSKIFRLIALLQPRFEVAHMTLTSDLMDPYQRVLVIQGMGDLAKEQSQDCIDWLHGQKMAVSELTTAARLEKQPAMAYQFFRESVRKYPWIRIEVFQTPSSSRIKFQAATSFSEVYKYEWDFGDGQKDVVAQPEHFYEKPGEYLVTLKIYSRKDEFHQRSVKIAVAGNQN